MHRREKARQIQMENLKIAQTLDRVKAHLPDARKLNMQYKDAQMVKGLRCKMPIVKIGGK